MDFYPRKFEIIFPTLFLNDLWNILLIKKKWISACVDGRCETLRIQTTLFIIEFFVCIVMNNDFSAYQSRKCLTMSHLHFQIAVNNFLPCSSSSQFTYFTRHRARNFWIPGFSFLDICLSIPVDMQRPI